MASTDFAEADIRQAVHCLLVRLAAADAYTGSGDPPTLAQLQQTAEDKMMSAYADTCRAAEVAYETVVGRTQQQTRAAILRAAAKGAARRTEGGAAPAGAKRKRPREAADEPEHGILQPLVGMTTRPTVGAGNAVQVGPRQISLGPRAAVLGAYWDTLHAADPVYALLAGTPKTTTPDETVLHAHTVLVADPTKTLEAAYATMRSALATLRAALLPTPTPAAK